ncbi:eCIS core domain-containing protein [Kitasatospora brasiliensis]|uniref:eCIS core domain-containing protein n=1 Tax=Kitasatospora brasiliensis TaxID=3058040 RepID=UPI00292CF740|nr:DUF4157 domain-containing protein [Kitasatospora sp. K002]
MRHKQDHGQDHGRGNGQGSEPGRHPVGARPAERARPTAAPGAASPQGLLALQSSIGNAAVVQMMRQARLLHGRERREHGYQPAAGGPAAVQRSAVHEVLRTAGRPLDRATRSDMEARLGADFSDVRVHDDSAAKASAARIGARAYTSGNHIVVGDGGMDRHTLAHELTHVIQQRQGPVAGTDNGSGLRVSDPSDRFEREAEANARRVLAGAAPAQREADPGATVPTSAATPRVPAGPVQRKLAPFANVGTPEAAYTGPVPVDTLRFHGTTLGGRGTTLGNSVSIEHLLRDTGGGSSPGYPAAFTAIRLRNQALVRERSRDQAATAMHAINGDFVAGANDTAANIFMGTARANNRHLNEVEAPIRTAMAGNPSGRYVAYQALMQQATRLAADSNLWAWNLPGAGAIPGLTPVAPDAPQPTQAHPLPQITHYVDVTRLPQLPLKDRPRILVYTVVPDYVATLTDYLQRNIDKDREVVDQARQDLANIMAGNARALSPEGLLKFQELQGESASKPNVLAEYQVERQQQIDNEIDVIDILIQEGPHLFPDTFTSTAEYWLATFDPAQPWLTGTETEKLNAQE